MSTFSTILKSVFADESGQDMVEYALILGLISIIAVGAVTATGTSIQTIWNNVSSAVSTAAGA